MLARIRKAQEEREGGFTLIELLVVIIIIGILAAIAIPTFLRQREKGYRSDMKSVAKNAATAIESYATETGGNYSALDGADETTAALTGEGFKASSTVSVAVLANTNAYCVTVSDTRLSGVTYKYLSSTGAPVEGACASPTS